MGRAAPQQAPAEALLSLELRQSDGKGDGGHSDLKLQDCILESIQTSVGTHPELGSWEGPDVTEESHSSRLLGQSCGSMHVLRDTARSPGFKAKEQMNSSILGPELYPLHILGYPCSFSGSPKSSSNSLGDDPEMAPGAAGDACQFRAPAVSAWTQQLLRQDIRA